MKKVVFFTDLKDLHAALENFNIHGFAGKQVPVKLHMGEMKNKYYSQPDFVKLVIDELKKENMEPYLFDTTVAYPGLRHSKLGYQKLAKMHGFTLEKVGCNVVIDDNGIPITVENREFIVARHLVKSTHIFAITHVKGHVATGMGGAIKNFGMGGVTKETKKAIHHGSRPLYQKDACTYCGICAEVCPFNALKVKEDYWKKSMISCFGCGVCVDACATNALTYEDADFQFALACAAKACVQDKNVIYLNELKRIARSCDCDPFAGPIISPDIGYLVADDPVAIDKASLDLIHDVKENVFEKENNISPLKQITFGEDIGLGSSAYTLIDL
ncbi:MAG: DUF362 domain-containing protein [Thermoplasmatales archaeon]|nr:MAG: DUF362 domain-containing protein [Thermoplasmatales archaeon]